MKVKNLKVSEQLKEQLKNLGEEWEVRQDGDVVTLTYMDAYEFVEVALELNEYGNVVSAYYKYANLTEEIITPQSCHDCGEYCEFYVAKTEECSITEDDINNEIAEWVDVPMLASAHFEVGRTIIEIKCYLGIPHEHLYKGYLIHLIYADNVVAFDILKVLDCIIEIYEAFLFGRDVRKKATTNV
ncbi:MAG: hypothetical protein QXG39_10435 [Candidatus Aenigmatarchaeota archaeon]